ncbi:MAG: Kelch repeat-containing protein [Bacteroidota bacterium]|jgi:N-acetylneuraminic acid mutarotase
MNFIVKSYILLFLIYNCSFAQTWLPLPDFPGTARDDGSTFTINNKAYCLTGLANSVGCTADGFAFDFNTNTWGTMAALPAGQERQYASAFSYSNFGYIVCGVKCDNSYLNDVWQYNSTSNTWTQLPNFPGGLRMGAQCFVIGSKAYLVSGINNASIVYNDIWEFDCINLNWTQKNNLPFPGTYRGVGFQINNTGYIGFGYSNYLTQTYNKFLYSYNVTTDNWQQVSSVQLPSLTYVGCNVINGKALFYCGQDSLGNNFPNNVIMYNPISNTTSTISGIPNKPTKGGMCFTNGNDFIISTGMVQGRGRTKETWQLVNPVSFKENRIKSLSIGPNPFQEKIIIKSDEVINVLQIYTAIGELVIEQKNIANHQFEINSTFFRNGIYFLYIDGALFKLVKS